MSLDENKKGELYRGVDDVFMAVGAISSHALKWPDQRGVRREPETNPSPTLAFHLVGPSDCSWKLRHVVPIVALLVGRG